MNAIDSKTISSAVLCSSSSDFCAGYDLKEIANKNINEVINLFKQLKRDQSPMGPCKFHWNKPVIAAIEGACVAGGLELALCADMRVGTTDSYYGIYNRRFGVPLIDGGTVRLPRLVGEGRALDLILTGRRVESEEALSMGLINRVVSPGESISEAVKLANEITAHPTLPMLNDRKSLFDNRNIDLKELLDQEMKNGIIALNSAIDSKSINLFSEGHGRHGSVGL